MAVYTNKMQALELNFLLNMGAYRRTRTKLGGFETATRNVERMMEEPELAEILDTVNRRIAECLAREGAYIAMLEARTTEFCSNDGEDEALTVYGLIRKARQNPNLKEALTAFLMFLGAHPSIIIDEETTTLTPTSEEFGMATGTPLSRCMSLVKEIVRSCDAPNDVAIDEMTALMAIILNGESVRDETQNDTFPMSSEMITAMDKLYEFTKQHPTMKKNVDSLLKLLGVTIQVEKQARTVIDLG